MQATLFDDFLHLLTLSVAISLSPSLSKWIN